MQIYKYMDIGTAKVTEEEKEGIIHHMIDIKDPDERFSVAEYIKQVKKIEQDIINKGKNIIIIGGTGLYVNSLIYGFTFEENDEKDYRKELEKSLEAGKETLETLYKKAKEIDEKAAKMISSTDKKRIFRILEIYYITNMQKTKIDEKRRKNNKNTNKSNSNSNSNSNIKNNESNNDDNIEYKLFYIDMERELLYDRINKRVDIMLNLGLIEETKKTITIIAKKKKVKEEEILNDYSNITALQAIGYREVISYLKDELTFDEMKEKIKQNTRRYAKRQITWFKKNNKIILDRTKNDEELIEIILENI